MKKWGIFFFCILACLPGFAGTLDKEFRFDLKTGETSRAWEINVPLPTGNTGKFIGREFTTNVTDSNFDFQMVKENLTDSNYYAKVKMVNLVNTNSDLNRGTLQVKLFVGSRKPNDVPMPPKMVAWKIGPINEMEWCGFGDSGKGTPVSAKYLYYQLKDEKTGNLMDEKVIPVYLKGFHFPITWQLIKNQTYTLSTSLSNFSGKYSAPNVGKIKITENTRK